MLEKGGHRITTESWPSLGFKMGDDGRLVPNKWLEYQISVGSISRDEAMSIAARLEQGGTIPARPFLAPAVREIRDKKIHVGTFADQLSDEIVDDYRVRVLKELTQWRDDID